MDMRSLNATDIFPKVYSIQDGKVVKNVKGEFYNEHVAEYVLRNGIPLNNELEKFDLEQLNIKALSFFRNQYSDLLKNEKKSVNLLNIPVKKFEIFSLNIAGGKTFLADSKSLPEGNNRSLYYDLDIANQIYQKIIDINDSSINEYDEISYLYERERLQIENEIMNLNLEDKNMYKKDTEIHNIIRSTSLYENYQKLNQDNERLIAENNSLNMTIKKYNEKIYDLSKKLKIALNRVEVLQNSKTFLEKIKELFNFEIKKN